MLRINKKFNYLSFKFTKLVYYEDSHLPLNSNSETPKHWTTFTHTLKWNKNDYKSCVWMWKTPRWYPQCHTNMTAPIWIMREPKRCTNRQGELHHFQAELQNHQGTRRRFLPWNIHIDTEFPACPKLLLHLQNSWVSGASITTHTIPNVVLSLHLQ